MSDLDTKAIEARLAKAWRGPWEIATATDGTGDTGITAQIEDETCVVAEVFSQVSGRGKDSWRCIHTAQFIAHAPADIAALLAEVARLQRERAEWRDRADALMTEQMTQMRDLTAEVEALRARLTLTPERVEAALVAYYRSWPIAQVGYTEEGRRDMRAALLAAGMEEEALQ